MTPQTQRGPALCLLALLTLSAAAMLQYYGWHHVGGAWHGPRLHLNLALAWAPYLFAVAAVACYRRAPHRRARLWPLILLWLLFLPNAPYLVTDWLYLPSWTDELWYSIGMMITFSMCGLMLGVISLYLVHCVVGSTYGTAAGWALAGVALGLSGLGMYLGRFVRLNSWDVFTHPDMLIDKVLLRAEDIQEDLRLLAFAGGASLLLALLYSLVWSLRRSPAGPEERSC
jgi:uncharacterized membrane protein